MLLIIPIAEESEAEGDYDKELEAEERAKVSIMLLNVQGHMNHGSISHSSHNAHFWLLRTVEAAYLQMYYTPIYFQHGNFDCKFLTNPQQHEHGVCNSDNNDVSQLCNWKQTS